MGSEQRDVAGRPGVLRALFLVRTYQSEAHIILLINILKIEQRNGPKWNDIVAATLGLELTNLAAGGATADNSFVAGGTGASSTIPVPSTKDQVDSFLTWDAPQPGDVFVHWIGANDILFNTTIAGAEIASLVAEDVDRLYRSGKFTLAIYTPKPF